MTKADFIKRVMQIMNEKGWNDTTSSAFVNSDTTKVESHIERVFVDAWLKAVKDLPTIYFTIEDFSSNRLVGDMSTGTGYVVLPDDFYMLSSFKMRGWQKNVNTLYDESDPIGAIQANEYVRGSISRPVCIRSKKSIKERVDDGFVMKPKDVLNYYSLPKGTEHKVTEALYIPLMKPLGDEVDLNEKLIIPLAYLCASKVFIIFEKPDIAKALEATAIEINN